MESFISQHFFSEAALGLCIRQQWCEIILKHNLQIIQPEVIYMDNFLMQFIFDTFLDLCKKSLTEYAVFNTLI